MKTNFTLRKERIIIAILLSLPVLLYAQSDQSVISGYMKSLSAISENRKHELSRYSMTATYINMDLYGNFSSKTRVTGDYKCGLPGDSAVWNNIFIAGSTSYEEPFAQGIRQEYMENFRYHPSDKMLLEEKFKKFPSTPENILARNLIWDMMAIESFTYKYLDSLKINKQYAIPSMKGGFQMADIGNYSHKRNVELVWKGLSQTGNELCAVIDFLAFDNKIELNLEQFKTKGSEQYWGSVLVSLKTGKIEEGVMYSGTIQEIEVSGINNKFLTKTIREVDITRIK